MVEEKQFALNVMCPLCRWLRLRSDKSAKVPKEAAEWLEALYDHLAKFHPED